MRKLVLILTLILYWGFSLAQTAQVSGYVYSDAEGNPPLEDVLVVLTTALDDEYDTITNTLGFYDFTAVNVNSSGWPTGITCIYSKPGFLNDTISTNIYEGDNNVLDTVFLDELGDVLGDVILYNGAFPNIGLVDSVNIFLLKSTGDTLATVNPSADGTYFIDTVPPGDYILIAELDKFQTEEHEFTKVNTEDNIINFELDFKPGNISGNVSLNVPEGSVENITINIGEDISLTPNEVGNFETTGIDAGKYDITYALEDFETVTINNFSLFPDQDNVVEDITLQWSFARLSGEVKDTEGIPLSGVELQIGDSEVYSNENGIYQFDKLPLPLDKIELHWAKEEYLDSTRMITLLSGYATLDLLMKFRPVIEAVDDLNFQPIIIGQYDVLPIVLQCSHSDSLVISIETNHGSGMFKLLNNTGEEVDTLILEPAENGTINYNLSVKFKPTVAGSFKDTLFLYAIPTIDTILLNGNGLDIMSASIQTSSNLVCPGSEVELIAIDMLGGNGNYSFEWQAGNDILGTTAQILVNPSEATDYKLKVTDDLGNSFETTTLIEVYVEPQIQSQPEAIEICAGDNAFFEIEVDDAANVIYQWKKRVGGNWEDISDANQKSIEIETNESDFSYFLKCEVSRCDFIQESENVLLTINPLPMDTLIIKGGFNGQKPVLIAPDSGKIYQWYRDDLLLENAVGQFYYAENYLPGSYWVKLTDPVTGCSVASKNAFEAVNEKNIVIYPNPIENQLYILLSDEMSYEGLVLKIADISGNIIREIVYQAKDHILEVDVADFRPGSYLLYIQSGSGQLIKVKRFVKVK